MTYPKDTAGPLDEVMKSHLSAEPKVWITYPPEMLPIADPDDDAKVVVCDENGNVVRVIGPPSPSSCMP